MRISSARIFNNEEILFGDFNVFIGGNGVGKTTIISELFHKAAEISKNKFHWVNQLNYQSTDIKSDLLTLSKSLSRRIEGSNTFYFSHAAKNINGDIDLDGDIRFSSGDKDNLLTMPVDDSLFNQKRYRRPFVTFSSCEARLSLKNESALTRRDHPPQDAINVLYHNKNLFREIDTKIFEIYKYRFVLLSHVGTNLQIGLSKTVPPVFDNNADSQQDEFEKIEKWKQENFTPIEEMGHGIRSMIRLMTSLLEPVNQVILIDEPEMHLYPSQKRWLGRELVRLATNSGKQVFLVTHDPMILQGVLDENAKTNIFRVYREENDQANIKMCSFDKPQINHSKNQEQFLQSLFYQRCIIVEGASDRSFYQQMFDTYVAVQDKDLGVVIAGGVGNSKHIADIVAKVGLQAAFIYDLDVLFENPPLLKDIYKALGGNGNPIETFEAAYSSEADYQNAPTDKKAQAIKKITGYATRSGFNQAWLNAHNAALLQSLENLSRVGIFVIPSGTLESWAPDIEEKVRFAEQAPSAIAADPALKEKFDQFSKKVLAYINIPI